MSQILVRHNVPLYGRSSICIDFPGNTQTDERLGEILKTHDLAICCSLVPHYAPSSADVASTAAAKTLSTNRPPIYSPLPHYDCTEEAEYESADDDAESVKTAVFGEAENDRVDEVANVETSEAPNDGGGGGSVAQPTSSRNKTLGEALLQLCLQDKGNDVTIRVDNRKFRVRAAASLFAVGKLRAFCFQVIKAVLACQSDFFYSMFFGKQVDRQKSEFQIEGVTPSVMVAILEFLYRGQTAAFETDLAELYEAALIFGMQTLHVSW